VDIDADKEIEDLEKLPVPRRAEALEVLVRELETELESTQVEVLDPEE
jgi:hypothetical protein